MTNKETLGNGSDDHENIGSHRQLIADNWSELSAIGVQGFHREGRGAVVIPVDNIADGVNKATYVSHASLDPVERETEFGWPSDEIEERVQTYNPEAQIVVVVMRQDGGANSYRVMSSTQPSDASVVKRN